MTTLEEPERRPLPFWAGCVGAFGLYLTLRGYRSFEGDQAYRLPLLLHQRDPTLYADDPFVRACEQFNPHSAYLALLDMLGRAISLPGALFLLMVVSFGLACWGLGRLSRSISREGRGTTGGLVTIGLLLATRAGNIGTNQLFEPILVERLLVFGLGWVALATAIVEPRRSTLISPILLGVGAIVHPSLGLLLAGLLGASWTAWALGGARGGFGWREWGRGVGCLAVALTPWLLVHGLRSGGVLDGLPEDEFRLLSFEIQGPQHMLPHLWRMPQWLAWACFPVMAGLGWKAIRGTGEVRWRFASLLGVCLAMLAVAWWAIEPLGSLKATLLQPFRLATVARGLCLVVVSARLVELGRDGGRWGRVRAFVVAAGLTGDWSMVIATATELAWEVVGWGGRWPSKAWLAAWPAAVMAAGLLFLSRHDTESGHWPLMAASGLGALWPLKRRLDWTPRRVRWAVTGSWAYPLAAWVAAFAPAGEDGFTSKLVERCRFVPRPSDDLERLAEWCRWNTDEHARFIGPPGPKSFRLWSRRAVAFNRAASPYHAAGLADWAERFRAHVGFVGTNEELALAYQRDRHGLESGYDRLTADELVALAESQGADHVLVSRSAASRISGHDALRPLRAEGRYAVFRVERRTGLARATRGDVAGTRGGLVRRPATR